ncbi:winged helix DNA-binding domain-containing protein [Allorhizocola rhizosphaerae]|uniref:winged helix DNA-binding domain-containing protein n=1 Tax=Allorhizocola rhizosphaerae TaxID=1872709 RepID=UPI000E3C441B|nr:winged helix DNA-binding domain-containing protein [Allorhizocola rhizosphaerae]
MRPMTMLGLNRATLFRQFLLDGVDLHVSTVDAVHRLAGLNAQDRGGASLSAAARGLAAEVDANLQARTLVRAPLLRGTQHIVTAQDYLAWWPVLRPVLARTQRFFGQVPGELTSAATDILAEGPLTRTELAQRLARRWPDHDPKALASSVQFLVPIVHPPGPGSRTVLALAEDWLGQPVQADTDPKPLIARYLAAFGPATVKDMQAWSGLTRLREHVAQMPLHELEGGLYDLPDAPLPDPDTPAPTRLLPYVDNLLTAHADRTRIMDPDVQRRVCIGAVVKATVLHDGRVVGTWWVEHGDLQLDLFVPVPGLELVPPVAHYPRY